MSATRPITLRLDPQDYERLEAEADRLGLLPGTLARVYVRAGLRGETAERRLGTSLAALDRLTELTSDLPPTDAVQVARDSRDELERRSLSL